MTNKKLRIAALADIHVGKPSVGSYVSLFEDINKTADVLVLGGDLTDRGKLEEAELLAQQLQTLTIPVVGVLGNHDFENNNQEEIAKILQEKSKMFVLDEEPIEIQGVGFAGVKGFMGGFDKRMLAPFGEPLIKTFVNETVSETLKLESQLERLETEYQVQKKVVVLHYAPIRETVMGEPEEIFPYLGSTKLEEPINAYDVSVVFHGHAHFAVPEGKTLKGIPVYNVASPIMQKMHPDKPYKIIEL